MSNNEEYRCSVCGDAEMLVVDEEGEFICTECLFERECEVDEGDW